ncbi:MAG: Hpt domain-containing protein [Desulfovibrionales bacterium]
MAKGYVETIDPELEGLVPIFLKNALQDLNHMQQALGERDFVTLARLGHSLKGAGLGYGFKGMADIGVRVEAAAKVWRLEDLQALVQEFGNYLSQVTVRFEK